MSPTRVYSVDFIVANITVSDEIIKFVFPAFGMVDDVVQFEKSGVIPVPAIVCLTTFLASISISQECLPPDWFRNTAIVCWGLSIFFENVHANR